ncbi:hypothetical protein B0A68_17045 [Flavobacterium reichenbachii]|uniref:YhhN-like protein n=2 Tax=Flavobacterium reichenbachii TaxID=362418 RepID=A0A085ZI13_9FLAO|nr:hypothetical protein IW19_00365 [Flavobacterium reichenbachii]OXB12872.1 hypothetical protein B0A68_17045 [Flavobacterium reichenbachii]
MDDFLIYSGYIILLFNLFLYLFSFSRKGKVNIFFISYLAFLVLVQFSMEVMFHMGKNNLFFTNVYFIGQMVVLGLFYYSILKSESQKKFVLWSLSLALLVLIIQYIFDHTQFLKFNLLEITITSLLVVIFGLLHFYNMLTDKKEYYYFTIGVVFYLLTSTVLFLVGNLTIGLTEELKLMSWRLNAFFIIIYYLIILLEWKVSFMPKKKININ